MKRTLSTIALTAALLAAQSANAYVYTCSRLRTSVLSGDDMLVGSAVGFSIGVGEFIAGLMCFVGNRQCGCLQNVVEDHTEDFSEAVAIEISECASRAPNEPAFGAMSRAVRRICPF
jgi:hypothetical protein